MPVRWTEQAADDLAVIRDFIAYRIACRRTEEIIEILTIFHSVRAFPESIG